VGGAARLTDVPVWDDARMCPFKIGETVTTTIPGFKREFRVIRIDSKSETVDLESIPISGRSDFILGSVRWTAICSL
jgi:hypothetical protein